MDRVSLKMSVVYGVGNGPKSEKAKNEKESK